MKRPATRLSVFPLCLLLAAVLLPTCLHAVTLPPLFTDHMILQRDMPIPIWGKGNPGESVAVRFAGQEVSTTVDENGFWRVTLAPVEAGGPHEMVIVAKPKRIIRDVLVGEVWIGSGQSNMAMALRSCLDGEAEAARATDPLIRLFRVPGGSSCVPLTETAANWVPCNPDAAERFSGLGYLFARALREHLDVPVGIIQSAVGGTDAIYWTPLACFNENDTLRSIVADWYAGMSDYVGAMAEAQAALETWNASAQADLDAQQPMAHPPAPLADPRAAMPSRLFNAMVYPVIPYAFRGVIWYQGEANVDRAVQYGALFPALIRGWRAAWGQGEFPFLFVQLANYMTAREEPVCASGWAELREAQMRTLQAASNTAMAVAIDIGDAEDIHPKNKQTLAARLALAARAVAYGETNLVYSGPLYNGSMDTRSNRVVLGFSHTGSGLATSDGNPPRRFEICGADVRFLNAHAEILDASHVAVWSDEVDDPLAVRYAWSSNPDGCNLQNREGLPASPFRTMDDAAMPMPKTTHIARAGRAVAPPNLDGKLDDPVWSAPETATLMPFRILESYSLEKNPTTVRLAWDADALYVGVRCAEPAVDGMAINAVSHDGAVYEDDSVEIFLDTNNDGQTYFQYCVNANGILFDTKNRWGSDWNGPCTAATGREPDAWTVELAIPWASLEMSAPEPGANLGLQLARTRTQSPVPYSQWAPTHGPTNHRPSHFGLLILR